MIPHNKLTLGQEEEKAAARVLRSGWLVQGEEVKCFENGFCQYMGLPDGHAVAVSSGTAALYLALWSLKAEGRRVAFPSYVCSALRNATGMFSGTTEILVDNEKDSPNLDLNSLKKSGAEIAIVPHMYGVPLNLNGFKGAEIIEDCAQALGAKVGEVPVGLQGRLGIFSFFGSKLMTTGGQGGMVVSKDATLIEAIRDYREFDCRDDQKKRFNFQMTDLQAAIGREQLRKLPGFLERREEIFNAYKRSGLDLLDSAERGVKPVRYRAVMRTQNPKKVIEALRSIDVKAIIPIEDWELLGDKKYFPNAYSLTQTTVSLPIYPSLAESDVQNIIGVLKNL